MHQELSIVPLPVLQGVTALGTVGSALLAQTVPDTWWASLPASVILAMLLVYLLTLDRPRERKEAKEERQKDRDHYEKVIDTALTHNREANVAQIDALKEITKMQTESFAELANGMHAVAQSMVRCAERRG